jgi:hypothetical protein
MRDQHFMRKPHEQPGINHTRQLPDALIEQRRALDHAKVEVKNREVVIGEEWAAIRGCPPRHRHLKTLMQQLSRTLSGKWQHGNG